MNETFSSFRAAASRLIYLAEKCSEDTEAYFCVLDAVECWKRCAFKSSMKWSVLSLRNSVGMFAPEFIEAESIMRSFCE